VLASLAPGRLRGFRFRDKGHDPTSIGALLLPEGRNDGLEIIAMLTRNGRTVSPDFIDNRVS